MRGVEVELGVGRARQRVEPQQQVFPQSQDRLLDLVDVLGPEPQRDGPVERAQREDPAADRYEEPELSARDRVIDRVADQQQDGQQEQRLGRGDRPVDDEPAELGRRS